MILSFLDDHSNTPEFRAVWTIFVKTSFHVGPHFRWAGSLREVRCCCCPCGDRPVYSLNDRNGRLSAYGCWSFCAPLLLYCQLGTQVFLSWCPTYWLWDCFEIWLWKFISHWIFSINKNHKGNEQSGLSQAMHCRKCRRRELVFSATATGKERVRKWINKQCQQ